VRERERRESLGSQCAFDGHGIKRNEAKERGERKKEEENKIKELLRKST
jgi:hypothetical protein